MRNILIIVIVLTLISAVFGLGIILPQNNKEDILLIKVKSKYSFIDTEHLAMQGYVPFDSSLVSVTYNGINRDTNLYLEVNWYLNSEEFYIMNYLKEYRDIENKKHVISMRADTFYYYVEDLNNHNKDFIVGKYNYLFGISKLSTEQIKYYMEHQDSLGRVRGNNLPPFPEHR